MPHPRHPKTNHPLPWTITAHLLVCLSTLFLLAAHCQIPLADLAAQVNGSYFFPFNNSSPIRPFCGININVLIYILIPYIALIAGVLIGLTRGSTRTSLWSRSGSALPLAGLIMFCSLMGLQTVNHWREFSRGVVFFAGQSPAEKKAYMFNEVYLFAEACRAARPGRHRAEIRSDINFSTGPGRTTHRRFAYLLLPEIDIRSAYTDRPVDTLIFYSKTDAANLVPAGYRILLTWRDKYLLAAREE